MALPRVDLNASAIDHIISSSTPKLSRESAHIKSGGVNRRVYCLLLWEQNGDSSQTPHWGKACEPECVLPSSDRPAEGTLSYGQLSNFSYIGRWSGRARTHSCANRRTHIQTYISQIKIDFVIFIWKFQFANASCKYQFIIQSHFKSFLQKIRQHKTEKENGVVMTALSGRGWRHDVVWQDVNRSAQKFKTLDRKERRSSPLHCCRVERGTK